MNKLIYKVIYIVGIIFFTLPNLGSGQYFLEYIGIQTQSLLGQYSQVHFLGGGNNFGGGIFRLPAEDINPGITITLGNKTKKCTKKLSGIYYNNQRGLRLWPLDNQTLDFMKSISSSYSNLSINGGFFTACEGEGFGIFGQIIYEDNNETSSISVGTKYNLEENIPIGEFAKSLEFFNGTTPIGYMYDTRGGIGLIGGKLLVLGSNLPGDNEGILNEINNGSSINEEFEYGSPSLSGLVVHYGSTETSFIDGFNGFIGNLRRIGILGSVGLGDFSNIQKNALQISLQNQISSITTSRGRNGDILNEMRKNLVQSCRNIESNNINGTITIEPNSSKINCYINTNYNNNNKIILDLEQDTIFNNKTIFVKNIDVIIKNSMKSEDQKLDLYVDGGNVLFDNNSNLTNIGTNGLPDSSSNSKGLYIHGKIYVYGLLAGWTDSIDSFKSRLILHGKFLSLNLPTNSNESRNTIIQNLFGDGLTNYIGLQDAFSRKCNPISGIGTDSSICGNLQDTYGFSSIIIIGKNL